MLGIFSSFTDVSVLVNGILVGAVYAAMAIGFSMIWGIVGVINLSQGQLLMMGGYVTWVFVNIFSTQESASMSVLVGGLLVAMVVVGILGYLIQRLLVNTVMEESVFLTLLLTFGIALLLEEAALFIWSASPRSIGVDLIGPPRYEFFGAVVPAQRLFIFILAVALAVAFYLYLKHTRTGRAIRAAGQNEQAAALIGIDIDHIYSVTFGISAALVAGTGGLVGITLTLTPQMGLAYTLKSFVVVVIGGLGSIIGALIGGLLLGLIEQIGADMFGTGMINAISFSALVLLLLVKPHGLFGEAEADE
jgi:branched-chain amino acid transport system permease protein